VGWAVNPQFAVLLLLGQQGALDQSELGALASVDRSTLSVLVDRMEARGLVTKTIDPTNRRCRIIELTDAGYRRLDDAAQVAEVVIGQVRECFDAEQFEQLVRLLPATSAGQFVVSKQLLRNSFRRPAVGTPRTSGNGELIHLMQNEGFLT
jgi:DNA-binding MarR family transcriptional regulator